MLRFKRGMQVFLATGAILIGVFAAGCRPHHHDDDDDDYHGGGGGGGGGSFDANLRDDGGHHDDSNAIPGYLYSIGGDVRNSGDDWSGGFWVDFYASENSTLTTSDWLIGSVYVGTIAPDSWANADLLVSFPGSIPPGEYYVGWIIDATDSVDETNESDNVVVLSGPSLVVGDDYEPNDSEFTAHYLGGPAELYQIDGTIGEDGDEDWFSFWQDDGFAIDIFLSSLPDDYELQLYADDGTLLDASSNAGTANESVFLIAPYTGLYYIRVQGWGTAHDAFDFYALDVDLE